MNGTFLKNMASGSIGLENIGLEVYLFRHVNQEVKYKSTQVNLLGNRNSNDELENLNDWLKDNIKTNLQGLIIDNEFQLNDYNVEVNLNDKIAEITLPELQEGSDLKFRYDKIVEAITNSDSEDPLNIAKFQVSKLSFEEEIAYIGYYRGMQKSTSYKKIMTYNGNNLTGVQKGIVNIGGDISFILITNKIFIINPRHFEFAFKYSDEINAQRDDALDRITQLPCFQDSEVKEIFLDKSRSHLYSRALAQIKAETFDYIEEYYNQRCEELVEIKSELDGASEEEVTEINENYGILIELLDVIDLDNDYTINLTAESNVTPLLHLFQDKIMESFLSKRIRSSLG